MSRRAQFVADVAGVPTHAFGVRSLTWWGVIGYMVIEAAGFGIIFATYFFLMSHESTWPPQPWLPPDLVAGTLFTAVILVSEIPNTIVKRAAIREDVPTVRRLMPWIVAFGAVLLFIRVFEFRSLNVSWSDNAYGSVVWALLLVHTIHLLTDWGDTIVLAALLRTPLAFEGRRMEDTDENALYWRFVWASWLPIYLLLYWLPRLLR